MVDFFLARLSNFSFPAFFCYGTLLGTRNLFCISSGWFQSKQSVFYRAVNYMLNSKCVSFIGNWHQTCEYWIYQSPSFGTFKTLPSNQLFIFVNHDSINLKMTSTLRFHICKHCICIYKFHYQTLRKSQNQRTSLPKKKNFPNWKVTSSMGWKSSKEKVVLS